MAVMENDPILTFIEQMGFIAQEDGLPRIAGQILGFLLIEGDARTLNEITEALGISKASASTNCRLLADKGALERVGAVGDRVDRYRAAENPAERTLAGMALRFRGRADALDDTANLFPATHSAAQARVSDFAAFFRSSADFLDQWSQHTKRAEPTTE